MQKLGFYRLAFCYAKEYLNTLNGKKKKNQIYYCKAHLHLHIFDTSNMFKAGGHLVVLQSLELAVQLCMGSCCEEANQEYPKNNVFKCQLKGTCFLYLVFAF